jgi:hypothetical protein
MFDNQGKNKVFRKGVYTIGVWCLLGRPRQSLGLLFAIRTALIRQPLSLIGDLGGGFEERRDLS